eukprot:CAMPEP_0202728676 /NCGR_PEP_ID=MMETSP1385-20130828/185748_1 /ASSEMBLY_ACC=CAM_ASM_000861 /TAXON_ID=933848 /ORGANISM="Elphidium margaritaceum" /LENGTH=443 /DNA_ID=CAMNT_0049394927 /DNA_START=21 /DNA_END=1352 /DNA_ORIENTATION=+
MSFTNRVLICFQWLLLVNFLTANTATRRVCNIDEDVCEEVKVDPNAPPTLGQKLLQKQTEFYHLNKPSYSEESAAQSIKIYNPNDVAYDYYWFDSHQKKGIYKGKLRPKRMTATNSYIGHVFYFTRVGTQEEVHRITVIKHENSYILPPTEEAKQSEFYTQLIERRTFYDDYFKRKGVPWLSSYARPPPILFMYNKEKTDPIGTIYSISSEHGFWHCIPDASADVDDQMEQCQDEGTITVDIESISNEPRLFAIEGLISKTEAKLIKQIARPKLHRSGTGQASDANYADDTRTSQTAWIGFREHVIIDTIYKRTADILQIDEHILKRNAEHMQTVFYKTGEEYKAHHDFADNGRDLASRYITILFYLTDQEDEYAGGETWLPKARDGKGIKVHPGKGNAVMFYNLLEDGNGDDLTLHEAVRVKKGEKWLANFWIWDPYKTHKA